MLRRVDPATQVGIEIGPLDKPIVERGDGTVYYVDQASAQDLASTYKEDRAVDIDRIVDVDFIWGQASLAELLGEVAPLDYIMASHVIEHVPDLVGWLCEAAAVLNTGGILALAVPDKRLTFDYLRGESTTSEVIGAYLDRPRRPSARQVFAHFSLAVELDVAVAWSAPIPANSLRPIHTTDAALDWARKAANGDYVDVHCWVFTPTSFVARIRELVDTGLLDFSIAELTPTATNELEFYVSLEKLAPDIAAEDKRRIQLTGLKAAEESIANWPHVPARAESAEELLERLDAQADALNEAELRIEMLTASTSWRVTAPLRFMGRALQRFRK